MSVERVVPASSPALSVVVPSIPRYDHEPTIDCLRQQSLARSGVPYEVLLVDDDALDRSQARNRGLQAADAAVVALTDDDTRPPPAWLSTIHDAFRRDDDLVCLEGPVYGGARNVDARRYVGCNLAVRRDVALAVGGFRSAYSAWGEDIEFGWRMEAEADGHCRFEPDMRMCHPSVPRTAMDADLERRLQEEYPERYAAVIEGSVGQRLYRRARLLGLTQPIQRARHRVRRLVRDPCPPEPGYEHGGDP